MITDYKITEIFCAVDEFCKEFDKQIDKKSLLSSDGKGTMGWCHGHRSVNNFIMSMIAALAAYCFFDNKPHALEGYCVENTKQLMLF